MTMKQETGKQRKSIKTNFKKKIKNIDRLQVRWIMKKREKTLAVSVSSEIYSKTVEWIKKMWYIDKQNTIQPQKKNKIK